MEHLEIKHLRSLRKQWRSTCSQVDDIPNSTLLTWAQYRAEVRTGSPGKNVSLKLTHKHRMHRRLYFSAVKIPSSLCAENANLSVLLTCYFCEPSFSFRVSHSSDLSEITNTFSFALIWLKSDECVPGRLRNAVWNCTWGSGFSGQKEIYEEVLGDGAAVVCGWLSLLFSPLSP